jgi:hypothetical protein
MKICLQSGSLYIGEDLGLFEQNLCRPSGQVSRAKRRGTSEAEREAKPNLAGVWRAFLREKA